MVEKYLSVAGRRSGIRVVKSTPAVARDLPFAEANLRSGYELLNVPASTQNLGGAGNPVNGGNDVLIDLQNIKRTVGALLIYGSSGQRIKVINGWWENSESTSDGAPYWRGGPRVRSSDGLGPEHISFTDMLIEGPSVPDAIALAASNNTRVTIQRTRVESRFAWDGQNLTEPVEHCDALQVQGPIGPIEIGLSTFWCMNVAAPNEGGKCFQLKREGGGAAFTVDMRSVNMRGGGRTGTFLLQTTRDILVSLDDVWANDDGITSGANWNWSTSGGGMFYPNSSAGASIAWTRSGASGSYVASWPAAAGITGQINQGIPPGGDFAP